MMRWMRPPELPGQRDLFDPWNEGQRYGLARELLRAIWNQACADATDSAGRHDHDVARRRFHAVAARLAVHGGRRRPDVGRRTRVETEIGAEIEAVVPPWRDAEPASRTPGRQSLVAVEAERWSRRSEPHGDPTGAGPTGVLRAAGGSTIVDPAPHRARQTAALVDELAPRLGLSWATRIHVDETADLALGARSSRGAATRDAVFLRSRAFDPRSAAGRYLLAHELSHVVQMHLGGEAGSRGLAEAEAGAVGRAFAAGLAFARPAAVLAGAAAAHDDDQTAKEDEFLKKPRKARMQITSAGLSFTPDPASQKWEGNIDRRLQVAAMELFALVGPAHYSPALVRETLTAVPVSWINIDDGPAKQDETIPPLTMFTPLASDVVAYLTATHKPPIPVLLTSAQIETLKGQADIKKIWPRLQDHGYILYPWYTETIFQIVMLANGPVLKKFQDAGADEDKFNLAQAERQEKLVPYEWALDRIRGDKDLTDHPAYRGLFNLPGVGGGHGEKLPPVDASTQVNPRLATEFLLDVQAHHPHDTVEAIIQLASGRKQLLEDFAIRMNLKKVNVDGDLTIADAPGKAVQAPDPATMYASPSVEPPLYERQADTEMLFWLTVHTPNMWEHFRTWSYYWEVIHVPTDELNDADKVGKDPAAHGTTDDGSFGRIVGTKFRRNLSNAEVDVKRTMFRIENILGPPGMGPSSIAAANGVLSMVGSVIKTAFGKFSEKPWEYTVGGLKPGVYVVRCRAQRPEDQTTVIHKMPSVAYQKIWVRPPDDVVHDKIEIDNAVKDMNLASLDQVLAKLKDPNLSPEDRKKLEEQAHDLQGAVSGTAETTMRTELRKLDAVKNDPTEWARLSKHDQDELVKRMEDLNFILDKRSSWLKDLNATPGTESPERLNAYFITQEGPTAHKPMKLLLEAVRMQAPAGKFVYAILDSTTKKGEHRIGPAADSRADAIVAAITALLEDVGYGRGKVSVSIPKGIWDVGAKEGEIRTFEIQKSDKQIALEGLENIALVGSIAAIAAAPFTGGGSLALLIPLGVVGAIPSAYRLAHSASEGTFEWDFATCMDILNCLGAVAGLGHVASSLKLVQVSQRVWMIIGLGMDGLQGIAGLYGLIDQLSSIDPSLPEGARMAQAMEIFGNALLQLGIAIGGRIAAEGQARRAKMESGATPELDKNISRATAEQAKPFTDVGIKDLPVFIDKSMKGPECHVKFTPDGYGMPSDIHIVMGEHVPPDIVAKHVEIVQLLQKYEGLFGWIRTLMDRVNALLGSQQINNPKTRGFKAAQEVKKIRAIMADYTQKIADGSVSKVDGESYLQYMNQELEKNQRALDEVEEGGGFIAAQAPKSADAVSHGYPPAPEGHYYVEEQPGQFQLRRHVGFPGDAKMVVPNKAGTGWDIVARPPEADVALPGSPAAKADPKFPAIDTAQLQLDVSRTLRVSSSYVELKPQSGKAVRVIPPIESGKGYVIHIPPDATPGMVEKAVARHLELDAQRPSNVSNVPLDPKGRPVWNGALEAEFRGRPAADDGYHWALRDGKLQYVREAVEDGQPEKPKLKWNDKLGALEEDKGPETRSWPKAPPATTKDTAFDDLGGNNPSSPFGKWVALMEEMGFKRTDLIDGLQDPSGLTYDTVRHNLKAQPVYADAIRKWLSDPALLRKRYPDVYKNAPPSDAAASEQADRIASHRAMLDLENVLPLKDATNWTERWYLERYGKEVKDPKTQTVTKVETQVKFDKDKANAAGIPISDTRVGDAIIHTETKANPGATAIETNTVEEIKSHSGELSADDKAQWSDLTKMLGKDMPRTGDPPTTTHIDSARQVFLDPAGGKANAEFIADQLASTPPLAIEFKVFNQKASPKTFRPSDFAKAGSKAKLAALIVAYCDS